MPNNSMPPSGMIDRSGIAVAICFNIMPVAPHRRGFRIANNGTAEIWFNDTGGDATAGGPGSFRLDPGDYYESPNRCAPGFPVSVIAGSVPGQQFSATEW